MKWIVKIVLIIFIAFIATPTIVSLIKNSSDKSLVYNITEEEENHSNKDFDLKVEFILNEFTQTFHFSSPKSGIILSENLSRHDNVSATIFIPPPERV